MEMKNIKRTKKREKKISVSIRIAKEISDFMRDNDLSPTKIFLIAVEEIRKKKKK